VDLQLLDELGELIVLSCTPQTRYGYGTVRLLARRMISVMAQLHEELDPPVETAARQLAMDRAFAVLFAGWNYRCPVLELRPVTTSLIMPPYV
jgi:hypothetical protein